MADDAVRFSERGSAAVSAGGSPERIEKMTKSLSPRSAESRRAATAGWTVVFSVLPLQSCRVFVLFWWQFATASSLPISGSAVAVQQPA